MLSAMVKGGKTQSEGTNTSLLRNLPIPIGTETIYSYDLSQKPFVKGR